MPFPPGKFEEMTDGFKPEAPSLLDCEMKCYYNLFHHAYRRSKDTILRIPMKDLKTAANHKALGFYNHEAMMQSLNQTIERSGNRLVESKKAEGMNLSILRDIVKNPNKSPAIIGVRFEYLESQGFPTKVEAEKPTDHSIIVLDVDWEEQLALIYDPMESFISRKRGSVFKREYPLAKLSAHWNGARIDAAWAVWLERVIVQTSLRGYDDGTTGND